MNTRKMILILLLIVLLMAAVGVIFYPQLPEPVATHWNAQGQADGYSSRLFAVGFLPLVTIGIALLLVFIPSFDPLKANVALFRREYDWFVIFFTFFMGYVHFLSLSWNLGWRVDMLLALVPAFAAMSFFIGVLLAKARRNWFIGIRTPWTLSNDAVWERTHRQASAWFKIAGGVTLLGLIFARYAFLFMIIPLILVSLYVVVLSYIEYKREMSKKI